MTTRTGGASRAREQLSPVDGMAQLSFVIQGMLERRAAEHDLSVIQTRLLGILRDRTPTMNEPDASVMRRDAVPMPHLKW